MSTRHAWVLGVLLTWLALPVSAHEARPALLQITETAPQRYEVLWKQPAQGSNALWLEPQISTGWLVAAPDVIEQTASYRLRRWRQLHAAGLAGVSVSVAGLDRSITDVLVSVTLLDGQGMQGILTAGRPRLVLQFRGHPTTFSGSYFRLGVAHILTGADHLLFVLGLMLLVRERWRLLKTVTAFTLAHSLTLAATALGWISVRVPLIEALVALSVMMLAVELVQLQRGQRYLAAQRPWLIAFIFGLLHGCAFAGALADVGLPQRAIAPALLLFNLGVEAGQLLFIASVSCALWLLRGMLRRVPGLALTWPDWTRLIAPYAIGSCAAVWFLQRVVSGA